VRYDLWVNQIGGQSQIIRQQNLITTSYTPGNSLPAGSYRAWIRAISSSGEFSPWSLEVAFAVAAIPQPSQSESLHGIPDDMIAVLAQELQSQRLGSNNTRVSSRSAEVELLPPTERTLKIVADDRISPQLHESCFAQFADEHLVAAIH
jgi:predicted phage tail protein